MTGVQTCALPILIATPTISPVLLTVISSTGLAGEGAGGLRAGCRGAVADELREGRVLRRATSCVARADGADVPL